MKWIKYGDFAQVSIPEIEIGVGAKFAQVIQGEIFTGSKVDIVTPEGKVATVLETKKGISIETKEDLTTEQLSKLDLFFHSHAELAEKIAELQTGFKEIDAIKADIKELKAKK